jgi:FkbM family methyltransferase
MNKLNVTFFECIKSWLYFLTRYPLYPFVLRDFYRAYNNYITMIVSFWKRRYPIKGVLKNGNTVTIKNERTLKFPWYIIPKDGIMHGFGYDIRFDIENEISIIKSCSMDKEIILRDSINNGDVFGIFFKGQYDMLPVKDAVVIDVGSNIGDSSIYFALQGAKRVIAVDPFPYNYMIAKENVNLNDLSKKINVLLTGCANETRFAYISFRESSILNNLYDGTQVKVGYTLAKDLRSEKFFRVKLFSLTDLITKYDIHRKAILKMDCQGCEYEVILSSSIDSLKRFSHILIEYHHGYKNIKDKLLSCGFKLSISKPRYLRTHDIGEPMYTGVIFAVNNQY